MSQFGLPVQEGHPDLEVVACHYLIGQSILLPRWFLKQQGHNMEAELKAKFPQLRRYQKESELKMEILRKVVDELPSLISRDILDLFKEIQNIHPVTI